MSVAENYTEWIENSKNIINQAIENNIIKEKNMCGLKEKKGVKHFDCKEEITIKYINDYGCKKLKKCKSLVYMEENQGIFITVSDSNIEGSRIDTFDYLAMVESIE